MSRKSFIESNGATCNNWRQSWSFVNEKEKFIIFGAWDNRTDGNTTLIFSEEWQIRRGRRQSAYNQSREHIRLIEEENYGLKTFPMIHSDGAKNEEGIGPAKIGSFIPTLSDKVLKRVGGNWYASDGKASIAIPEEVENPETYLEGASKTISVNSFERNRAAREKCLAHHGYKCIPCGFNFKKIYGVIGESYIHVHHVVPLSQIGKEYKLNPEKDLVPVCANCHAMIHRVKPALTIDELKKIINEKQKAT